MSGGTLSGVIITFIPWLLPQQPWHKYIFGRVKRDPPPPNHLGLDFHITRKMVPIMGRASSYLEIILYVR